jgi:hypothetical protein
MAVLIGAPISEAAAQSNTSFDSAIDAWSRAKGVAVTPEVREGLAEQVGQAAEVVKRRKPSISKTRLDQLAPKAAVTYLEMSQNKPRGPTVTGVFVGLATGQQLGAASATEYPVLYVDIVPAKPENFVVSIDGKAFRAGLKVFRVTEGDRAVHVTRVTRPPCDKTIKVTSVGPNRVRCAM